MITALLFTLTVLCLFLIAVAVGSICGMRESTSTYIEAKSWMDWDNPEVPAGTRLVAWFADEYNPAGGDPETIIRRDGSWIRVEKGIQMVQKPLYYMHIP